MKILIGLIIALVCILTAHITAWIAGNIYYRNKVNKYQLGIYRTRKRKFNDSMIHWFEIWTIALVVSIIVAYFYEHCIG